MVGGLRKRNVNSFYKTRPDEAGGSGSVQGKGGGTRRVRRGDRRRPRSPSPVSQSSSSSEEEEEIPPAAVVEDEEEDDDEEGKAEEDDNNEEEEAVEQEAAGGSTSSTAPSVWLRGPSRLPRRPIPEADRPVIRPRGQRSWLVVRPGTHKRKVSGILGLLCKTHYPGVVHHGGVYEPAYTFDHFVVGLEEGPSDRFGRSFPNKAERVKAELWHSQRAAQLIITACRKLVKDMHYEARVQSVIQYYATEHKMKVKKVDARTMYLTREQYLLAVPWWCAMHPDAWRMMVDKWCDAGWVEQHDICRQRRLMMPGASHHQGSLTLDEYSERWSASHEGQELSKFQAWALSHKGKATSDVQYNANDPPEAYSNATIFSRLSSYSEVGKQLHGPDWDPSAHDIDGEVAMIAGGGKKHGRFLIGDSTVDTASTPSLSQIRARSTDSRPAVRERPTVAQMGVEAIQTQLEEERRRREKLEQRLQQVEAQREQAEAAERARQQQMEQHMQQHINQHMTNVYEYITRLSQQMGASPPTFLAAPMMPFTAPLTFSPNPPGSAASNDGPNPGAELDIATRLGRNLFGPDLPPQ
ncbi:unnamed protein product [Urochloa humidicola]